MDKSRTPPVPQGKAEPAKADIAAFLEAAKRTPAPVASGRGRLIFALDATMSRQPTWDLALGLQARMFEAAAGSAGSRCSSSISAASANAAPRDSSPAGRASPTS